MGARESCGFVVLGESERTTLNMIGPSVPVGMGTMSEVAVPKLAALSDTEGGGSLLLSAAAVGNHKAVAAILDAKADPDARDLSGNTALLVAAASGHKSTVKALLRAGADMLAVNHKEQSATAVCFAGGHASLGCYLLKKGAAGHVDGEEEEEDGGGGASDGAWAWREEADLAGRDAEALIAAMDLGLDMSLLDDSTHPVASPQAGRLSGHGTDKAGGRALAGSGSPHRSASRRDAAQSGGPLPGRAPRSSTLKYLEEISSELLGDRPPAHQGAPSNGDVDVLRLESEEGWAEHEDDQEGSHGRVDMDPLAELEMEQEGRGEGGRGRGEGERARRGGGGGRSQARRSERAEALERVGNETPQQRLLVSESIALIGQVQASHEASELHRQQAKQEAEELETFIQQELDDQLRAAAAAGDHKEVERLCKHGADPSSSSSSLGTPGRGGESLTPLQLAAWGGHKRCVKALLREGAAIDSLDPEGRGVVEIAFSAGHHELAEYLLSKGAAPLAPAPASGGRLGAEADERQEWGGARGGTGRVSSIGKQSVAGLDQHLSDLEMSTYPVDMLGLTGASSRGSWTMGSGDRETSAHGSSRSERSQLSPGDGSRASSARSTHSPTSARSPARKRHGSVLGNLEEQDGDADGRPAWGEGRTFGFGDFSSMDHVDALLQEAEAAATAEEDMDIQHEIDRILRHNPVPRSQALEKLEVDADLAHWVARATELKEEKKKAVLGRDGHGLPPRCVNGLAVVITITCEDPQDGLGCAAQYSLDQDLLRRTLPSLGFTHIQFEKNLTRDGLLIFLKQLVAAMRPGGNLAEIDSLLVYIASSGTPSFIDCYPTPVKISSVLQDRPLAIQEIVAILGECLGSRPKVVLLAVCGDQKARGLANVNVELIPRQSDSSLYQFAVDDKPGMVLVMAVTAGKVNWAARTGSLLLRILVECFREESDSNSILRLINSTTKSLRDFCIKRQGTGSSECPIGLAYYNNFFLLHPVVFAYPGADRAMLGPDLQWSLDYCMLPLDTANIAAGLVKKGLSSGFVTGAARSLPSIIHEVDIRDVKRIAFELEILSLEDTGELFVGVVLDSEKKELLKADRSSSALGRPSAGAPKNARAGRAVTPMNGLVVGKEIGWAVASDGSVHPTQASISENFQMLSLDEDAQVMQDASNGAFGGGSARTGSAESSGKLSNASKTSGGSRPASGISHLTDAPPTSADGSSRLNTATSGASATSKHAGLRAGSKIQMWHDRTARTLEFLVDGKHVKHVFQDIPDEPLVPAVTAGAHCHVHIIISRIWQW